MHKTYLMIALLLINTTTFSIEKPQKTNWMVTQFVRETLKENVKRADLHRMQVKEGSTFDYLPGEIIVAFNSEDLMAATSKQKDEWRAEIKIQEARMRLQRGARDLLAIGGSATASTLVLRQIHKACKTMKPFTAMRGPRYKVLFGLFYAGLWPVATLIPLGFHQCHQNKQLFEYLLANTQVPTTLRKYAEKYENSPLAHEQKFAKSCLAKAAQLEKK